MKSTACYKIIIILLLVSSLGYRAKTAMKTPSTADKRIDIKNINYVSLEGIIDDPTIASDYNGFEVHVIISKYPFNYMTMQRVENKRYVSKVKNKGEFELSIPIPASRFYMYLTYTRPKPREFYWSSFDNIYILEKGDQLNCILSNTIFTFSGKGADKLNCQSEIYKLNHVPENIGKYFNSSDYVNYVKAHNSVRDSIIKLRLAVVEKYRSRLGVELSEILKANCYGLKYFSQLNDYPRSLRYATLTKAYAEFINTDYYKRINIHDDLGLSPSVLTQAPLFTDYLFLAIQMRIRKLLPNGELENGPEVLAKTYTYITNNYVGLIRDKLIATFFVHYRTSPTILNYLDKSLSLIKKEPYRELVENFKRTRSTGVAFYPFVLENTEGRLVKLEDLKDKVVIIDFWFTGCVGCANFKSSMSEVWETYKNNPKVAFVSISIDKKKELWKESVQSRKYTEPEAINLYTNGEGKLHPIIIALNISQYPTPYVLKSGKIYSSTPPMPTDPDVAKDGPAKQFVELIATAISELDHI